MSTNTLTAGGLARIEKGCRARNLKHGARVCIDEIRPMGREYGHSVRVVFTLLDGSGRRLAFHARHINRLADPVVRLNDGNPLHVITLKATTVAVEVSRESRSGL